MSQFLYFIETPKPTLPKQELPARLREIWRDVEGGWNNQGTTINGVKGLLLWLGDGKGGYYPEKQQWHKSTCGEYRIGWWDNDLPRAADLLRERPLDGGAVRFGNGEEWVVPILHGAMLSIPRAWGWGPNGSIELQTIGGYEQLLADSESYISAVDGERPFPPVDEFFAFVTQLLGVNYRVASEECAALTLIGPQRDFILDLLHVCLGIVALKAEEEAQKKITTPPVGSEDSKADAA